MDGNRGKEMSGVRNSRNPSDCSVLTHSDNSGHTATLRSAQMLGFASHFICPQTLYAIGHLKNKLRR